MVKPVPESSAWVEPSVPLYMVELRLVMLVSSAEREGVPAEREAADWKAFMLAN